MDATRHDPNRFLDSLTGSGKDSLNLAWATRVKMTMKGQGFQDACRTLWTSATTLDQRRTPLRAAAIYLRHAALESFRPATIAVSGHMIGWANLPEKRSAHSRLLLGLLQLELQTSILQEPLADDDHGVIADTMATYACALAQPEMPLASTSNELVRANAFKDIMTLAAMTLEGGEAEVLGLFDRLLGFEPAEEYHHAAVLVA